ncbi:aminotransferase class V-fold PLP-dependent enzyme [Flavobacteriaceae bacterium]|nr:aminotransferase class V-fold PLP-dependent enzyme [Flavobacteriaceae bacterium]
MYSDSSPLLTNCTYLNTAYVGPMSTTLSEFRRKLDEDLVQNGGDYKVRAYEALEETHEIIANFFGAYSKQSFIVPNFSYGIRHALSFLPKKKKVLLLEEDYPSLCKAFDVREFDVTIVPQKEDIELSIKAIIETNDIEILALSVVQYTSGLLIDIDFLKELKQQFPKLLIVGDGTQFLGAHPYHFSTSPFDVLVASGYKWLLAGFGNGLLFTSDYYYKFSDITPEVLYNQIFTGHFNMLATASLKFAIQELERNDFMALMEQKEQLAHAVKLKLTELDYISPWVSQRKSHSSIFSLRGGEVLYESLKKNNIKCVLRGNGVRVSFHFYNQLSDLETLVQVLNSHPKSK